MHTMQKILIFHKAPPSIEKKKYPVRKNILNKWTPQHINMGPIIRLKRD